MSNLHPLARAVGHPSPGKRIIPIWRVVFGIMLAPFAFTLQVVVSYVVAAKDCAAGGGASGWLIAINLAALLATIAGMAIAIANFQATRDEKPGGHARVQDVGEGRTRFLAYCGLCASVIFGLAVIVQFTAILTLSECLGFASYT